MTSDKPALTASTEWPERVYELQKTDPVDAGEDGIDNLAPNQLAARTNYLRVKGIADWAAVWNYPAGAFCQEAGVVYRAVTANAGKPPASNPAIWTRCPMTAAEIANEINLSDKQPVDATLTALAGLNTSADRLIYATGADQFALTPLTAFIRTLLDDADAATARATLGAAPLASPALTGTPTTPTAADGTNTTQIASTAFVQSAVGGYLSKSVTGGTVNLSDLEASNPVIGFSGTLTSNLVVVVPTTVKRLWAIYNATSGAFTLTVKTATGSGVTVAQGKRNLVYTDGTSVYDGFNDFENIALTGVPTAPTAATGTNTTQVATTAYVNAEIAVDRPFEATAANIKMNGAQSVGTLNTVARGDHVHPTDTSRAPLLSPAFTGSPSTPTPALFNNSAAVANMSAVQSAKGSYNHLRGSHAGQITEAMLGNAIQVAGNVTLPSCTSKHAGAAVTLFATANATVSVSNPAVDFIYEPGLLGLQNTTRSITLAPGEEVVLSNRGGAEWNVVGGNLVATRLCARKTDADNTYLRKDSTFTNWYPSHYAGAQVFVSKQAKLKIQTIKIDNINKTGIFNLPEGFDGVWDVTATDRGSGKFPIGITAMNNNQFQLWSDCPGLFVTVTAIGFAN